MLLHDRAREGEKGVGAVSSGGGLLAFRGRSGSRVRSRFCSRFCSRGVPFEDENAHGIPFAAEMWRDARKSADSRIFGEKGRRVA